jgi:hypothetical protein
MIALPTIGIALEKRRNGAFGKNEAIRIRSPREEHLVVQFIIACPAIGEF